MIPDPHAVSRALVRWFTRAHRDLPWRRTRDPYAIWVSEIMLQQTRVEAVVPYYERFLARFPSVHALAGAPADDVLHAWSGLGYYRRARQLHAAAAVVVRDHAGLLPADELALRALPGIGRYTAGAIRSIAFGAAGAHRRRQRCRACCRASTRCAALPARPGARSACGSSPPRSCRRATPRSSTRGSWNWAPRCACRARRAASACPLAALCVAHARGREEAFPPPRPRAAPARVTLWAVTRVRAKDGAVLMRKRGADEVNAGQWEVPLTAPAARPPRGAMRAGAVRHGILKTAYAVEAYVVRVSGATPARATRDRRWIGTADRATLPLTTLTRKLLALLDRG